MNRKRSFAGLWFLGFSVATSALVWAQEDPTKKLALTPPMGWNSWNCIGGKINDASVREIADAMVRSGMKDAGYEYIVIDDIWQKGKAPRALFKETDTTPGRDERGEILANPEKFPNGIRAVADYVHSQGLKFGLYTVPGRCSCGGFTGSWGHEKQDVETFARWGVDFIKLDFCGGYEEDYTVLLDRWHGILAAAGRPIILSSNSGYSNYAYVRTKSNMWRTTSDLRADWEFPPEEYRIFPAIRDAINLQVGLHDVHGPGGWCDPDMLQLGNRKLTDDENRAHFSMWAMLAAPLLAGNDLRTMSEATRQILTNTEVIAVDQDPAGLMGHKVLEPESGLQIWTKRLRHYGSQAVALLNHTDKPREITASWPDLGIHGPAFVRDLWQHKDLGEREKSITAVVPSHGIAMFKVIANELLEPYPAVPPLPAYGVIYEAEDRNNVFGGGKADQQHPGYSGSGYVLGVKHEWRRFEVIWNFQCPAEGTYHFQFRYSQPAKIALDYELLMTGSGRTLPLKFDPGKDWTEWKTLDVIVELPTGGGQIAMSSTNHEKCNELAVDYLKITPIKLVSSAGRQRPGF